MLEVEKTALTDVLVLTPKRFADARGFFTETFNAARFAEAGVAVDFIQDNHSHSARAGTVRGLHFQAPPFAQSKLVRVLAGAIIDVAVDARLGSPTYGRWVGVELSAENGRQIFVPKGFLHGFITLEPDTAVAYKVDAYYDRESDGAVKWDDPDLAIDWGPTAKDALLSEKDAGAQSWAAFASPFRFDG